MDALVGQLHDDDQPALNDLKAFQGKDERMADTPDSVQGLQLLRDQGRSLPTVLQVPVEDFDGLEQAAGGFRPPDFPETALPEAIQKPIPRNHFRLAGDAKSHRASLHKVALRPEND